MARRNGNWFTSVELDEPLFDRALALSGIKTKKAFFDEIMRVYVRLHEQAQVTKLRGKLVWKSVDEPKG
ncbi:MAG TPA: type II toxin-antitoxin system VapB family antitoxin [Thermoanaerobaculia bacterium]|jgi:Arc/MetJ family transcription regulator|nr:type II toxin-antitoxin system VapB family antitoxin [Thermoanaerobaculia bacterium]